MTDDDVTPTSKNPRSGKGMIKPASSSSLLILLVRPRPRRRRRLQLALVAPRAQGRPRGPPGPDL